MIYGSFDELVNESDLVVVGILEERVGEISRSSDGLILHFATDFRVQTVVQGEAIKGDVIRVLTSTLSDGVPLIEDGADASLEAGKAYYLFLLAIPVPGVFASTGGAQGQLLVTSEGLIPLSGEAPTSKSIVGLSSDELSARVATVGP